MLAALVGGSLLISRSLRKRAARRVRRIRKHSTEKLLDLRALATNEFRYFPGKATGYAGYTDYNAMNYEVNDGLIGRTANEQFVLVGFGVGFMDEAIRRVEDSSPPAIVDLHIEHSAERDAECIGWLSYLQTKGTDNAPPSSENLQTILRKVSAEIGQSGPISLKFWDKVRSGEKESLDRSQTSPEELRDLMKIFQQSKGNGARIAAAAAVVSHPR